MTTIYQPQASIRNLIVRVATVIIHQANAVVKQAAATAQTNLELRHSYKHNAGNLYAQAERAHAIDCLRIIA